MSLFPPQKAGVWLGSGEDYCNWHTGSMASFSHYIAFLLALRLRTRKSRLPTAKHQRGVLVCMCVPFVHGHSGLKLAHFGVPVSKIFIWTFNLKSLKARSGYVLISEARR